MAVVTNRRKCKHKALGARATVSRFFEGTGKLFGCLQRVLESVKLAKSELVAGGFHEEQSTS